MKKYSFLLFLLVACNQTAEQSEKLEKEPITTSDKIELDSSSENDEAIEESFTLFEHYAQLRTPAEIYSTFGKENCLSGTSWYAEGTIKLKHILVTNPKNKHVIKYVFEENSSKKIGSIEANYRIYDADFNEISRQVIKSECGFTLGMKINELKKWNGKDFQFSGFGWDYGGGIFIQPGDKLEKCKTRMILEMFPADNDTTFNALYGDQELSTKSTLVQKAPIFVQHFALYLD